jgi:pimeloyl-ACP methyl ester carboxylesterase
MRRVPGAGLSLAYREWNADADGEPLVLLHGITGSSADWEATARRIPNRRIIAFDARGTDIVTGTPRRLTAATSTSPTCPRPSTPWKLSVACWPGFRWAEAWQ